MNPTQLGQQAKIALSYYRETFPSIKCYTKETSTIYKVIDSKQEVFAMKLYEEVSSKENDNRIEQLILETIKKANKKG